MKKTAMQLLIDKYEKEAKKSKSPAVQYLLEMVLNDIKEMKLLENNREQIEEAYNCGNLDNDGFSPDKLGEQYYKDTYEQ
jgi:hypothetical protein